MGKLIQFPLNDCYYNNEDWEYEDYYDEENYLEDYYGVDQDYGMEIKKEKENCIKGFIRRLLIFVLDRL
jgi:hypothetical protein